MSIYCLLLECSGFFRVDRACTWLT